MHLVGSMVIFPRSEGLKSCSLELLLSFKRWTMFPPFSISGVLQIWLCKDQQTLWQSNGFPFCCCCFEKNIQRKNVSILVFHGAFYLVFVLILQNLSNSGKSNLRSSYQCYWRKKCVSWLEKINYWMVSSITGEKRKLVFFVPKLHRLWRSSCHSWCILVMNWEHCLNLWGFFNWCSYSSSLFLLWLTSWMLYCVTCQPIACYEKFSCRDYY